MGRCAPALPVTVTAGLCTARAGAIRACAGTGGIVDLPEPPAGGGRLRGPGAGRPPCAGPAAAGRPEPASGQPAAAPRPFAGGPPTTAGLAAAAGVSVTGLAAAAGVAVTGFWAAARRSVTVARAAAGLSVTGAACGGRPVRHRRQGGGRPVRHRRQGGGRPVRHRPACGGRPVRHRPAGSRDSRTSGDRRLASRCGPAGDARPGQIRPPRARQPGQGNRPLSARLRPAGSRFGLSGPSEPGRGRRRQAAARLWPASAGLAG